MWLYATGQNVIAVDHQMMRCDGCGKAAGARFHIVYALLGGDMFHNHLKIWVLTPKWIQHAIYKHHFTIKNINSWICHLSVNAKRTSDFSHLFQCGLNRVKICDTGG